MHGVRCERRGVWNPPSHLTLHPQKGNATTSGCLDTKLKHIHSGDKAKENTAVRCELEKTNRFFQRLLTVLMIFVSGAQLGAPADDRTTSRVRTIRTNTHSHTTHTHTARAHKRTRDTRAATHKHRDHPRCKRDDFSQPWAIGRTCYSHCHPISKQCQTGTRRYMRKPLLPTIRRATARWSPSPAVLDRKITYVANSHFRSALQHTSWCSQAGTRCLNNTLAPACARHHAKNGQGKTGTRGLGSRRCTPNQEHTFCKSV